VAIRHSKHFHNKLLKEKGRVIYTVKCITDIYKVTVQLLHILSSYIFMLQVTMKMSVFQE